MVGSADGVCQQRWHVLWSAESCMFSSSSMMRMMRREDSMMNRLLAFLPPLLTDDDVDTSRTMVRLGLCSLFVTQGGGVMSARKVSNSTASTHITRDTAFVYASEILLDVGVGVASRRRFSRRTRNRAYDCDHCLIVEPKFGVPLSFPIHVRSRTFHLSNEKVAFNQFSGRLSD